MKISHGVVFAAIGFGVVQVTACSSSFSTCEDSRSCPDGGTGGSAGGTAGKSSGGKSGSGGNAGRAGAADGGAAGVESSAAGEAGAIGVAGEGGGPVPDCALGDERPCSQGGFLGACASGVQACTADGHWSDCSVKPKTKDACTAGNDDNCNGVLNEGCPCVQNQQRSCADAGLVGPCAAGKQTCGVDATWGACSIAPAAADTCVLGNNDNCSGPPNEGCLCIESVTTKDCGVCQDGTQTCTNGKTGQFGACTGGSTMKTYYLDADGDGHAVNVSTTVCGRAPAHYITGPVDDCYDGNKDAFPGQTKFFNEHRGDGSFDYNCDNNQEKYFKEGDSLGYTTCSGSCTTGDPCVATGTGHVSAQSAAQACGTRFGLLAACACTPGCGGISATTPQSCR